MTSSTPAHIDNSTWKPLLELATKEVFELMVNATVVSCAPAVISPGFMAMVGLAGQLRGVLSVRCSTETALQMASQMLGVSPDEAGEDKWDAAAEVCNMIAGNFKAKLSGIGSNTMLSVPTVVTGTDFEVKALAHGENLQAWLSFEGRPLWIVLELHA